MNTNDKNKLNYARDTGSSGFSLIEAVVATTVFSLALSGIIGSFIAVVRLDQKSRSIRLVEENARYISEFLTREIRNGSIDFGSTGYNGSIAAPGKTSILYLINPQGETESFSLSGNALRITKVAGISNISSNFVRVSNLNFYISPFTAPGQQRVTYTFTIASNTGLRPQDQITATFQSSVAVRDY